MSFAYESPILVSESVESVSQFIHYRSVN